MKNRKMVLMASALLVFAVLFFGMMNVNATQWTVGVKAGDSGEYSITMGSSTSGTYSGTVKIEVTNVKSSTIYYDLSYNPAVPEEYAAADMFNGSVDISNSNITGFYLGFFIAANRNAGEQCIGEGKTTINATEFKEYCGQNVEVNFMSVHDISSGLNETFYWVRATGMLAEIHYDAMYSGTPVHIEMTLTSASVIPEFPISSLLVLTFVVTTLSSAIVLHRKKYATRAP